MLNCKIDKISIFINNNIIKLIRINKLKLWKIKKKLKHKLKKII